MSLCVAFILDPADLWIAVLFIGAWMVFMCLNALATDIEFAIKWHDLKVEAHNLREKHARRLRDLAMKGRAVRGDAAPHKH